MSKRLPQRELSAEELKASQPIKTLRCVNCGTINPETLYLRNTQVEGMSIFYICPECGVVFIPKPILKRINKEVEKKQKKRAMVEKSGLKLN